MWPFRKKTRKEKLCTLASMEKELEVIWKLETTGGYVFGMKNEIISLERQIAYLKADLEIGDRSVL